MPKRVDLTGQQFGRLTVLEYAGSIGRYGYWYCECDCGDWSLVNTSNLKSGNSQSCGCLQKEQASERGKSAIRHGGKRNGKATAEYAAWDRIRNQGTTPVPFEWNDFSQFFKDVGWKPSPEHQLARHDNRIPHSKENTYWRDPNAEDPRTYEPSPSIGLRGVRASAEAERSREATAAAVH